MNQPLSIQNDGMFLLLYLVVLIVLIGTLLFAVDVKRLARRKKIN